MSPVSDQQEMEAAKAVHSCILSELTTSVSLLFRREKSSKTYKKLPRPSRQCLHQSLSKRSCPNSADPTPQSETVLYLAYGSNLCAETFRGARGIEPLSELNVVVPELVMTFDLPGIPYSEPCFANTARRDDESVQKISEKDTITDPDYHKKRWHKGLVGVVYEVTRSDYAHIIATEGGGSGYQDILVDAFPLPSDPSTPVPEVPSSTPFKCHTLFAPIDQTRAARPDPNWAQPSPRYMKLITDGADEHDFPEEYKEYLHGCRTYVTTSARQRLGQFIFLSTWVPIIITLFGVARMFAGDDGRYPPWLVKLSSAIFTAIWASYDSFYKPLFGEGERTVDDPEGSGRPEGRRLLRKRRPSYGAVDLEGKLSSS